MQRLFAPDRVQRLFADAQDKRDTMRIRYDSIADRAFKVYVYLSEYICIRELITSQ